MGWEQVQQESEEATNPRTCGPQSLKCSVSLHADIDSCSLCVSQLVHIKHHSYTGCCRTPTHTQGAAEHHDTGHSESKMTTFYSCLQLNHMLTDF